MPLYLFNNKLLINNGKLAASENCCCQPGVCVFPTMWRIRDSDGNVWFTGDIEVLDGQQRLLDFPAAVCGSPYPPQPWLYLALEATLVLEVLGCSDQWDLLAGPEALNFGQCGRINMDCTFPLEIWQELPEKCRCRTDALTGEIIRQDPNDPNSPCEPCYYSWGYDPGPGLSHLTSGRAVTFTGAVDGEGSNLANWEDANGNSPASELPNENSDIVINSSLTSWYTTNVLTVKSITINNCQFAASAEINATDLTATGAEILAVDACGYNYSRISLSGKGTLNGSLNRGTIIGNCDFLGGSLNTGSLYGATHLFSYSVNEGIVAGSESLDPVGSCAFSGAGAGNAGTVIGPCTFTGDGPFDGSLVAYNDGTVIGNCVFDAGLNYGTIEGECTFMNGSTHEGAITGNCSFDLSQLFNGTIDGDATFDNESGMDGSGAGPGAVTGNAAFAGGSILLEGTVGGDATFDTGSFMSGGSVTGTATFTGGSCYSAGTAGTFVPDPPPAC